MIERKEYKFINIDRWNNICELNTNDIAHIKNNILLVTFNLTYPAYISFEIKFKPYEDLLEKLNTSSKMNGGYWMHSDAQLAETLRDFLNEHAENYDNPIIWYAFKRKY